jgi:nucleoside 2-deoxyribosyltransferase
MNISTKAKRIYLASPYSDKDPKVRQERFEAVAMAAAYMMDVMKGVVIYSPIIHSHVVAQYLSNELDHDFWLHQDVSHILSCQELVIYKIPGYDKSFGVIWEIGFANGNKIPVSYVTPDEVAIWATSKGLKFKWLKDS